ncbi:MAG: response regulator [Burkholderiales bacterium]
MHQKSYILVVESDDLIRQLLERWLGEAGYAVVAAASCPAALERVPCLVIANVSSPRNAAELIRSLQVRHAAPILVVSARFRRGLGSSVEVAQRLGVGKVLPKPFTREELLAAVGESIGGP